MQAEFGVVEQSVNPSLQVKGNAVEIGTDKFLPLIEHLKWNLPPDWLIAYVLFDIVIAGKGRDICGSIDGVNLPVVVEKMWIIVKTCLWWIDLETWESLSRCDVVVDRVRDL